MLVGLTQVLLANDDTTQTANLYGLDLISQDDGTGMRTLLVDGLGSVRQETAGGVVETTTTYGPYGALLTQTGASGTVYGYTGEQEDSATGLVYLRARYYNPYLNQFQSRDPWDGSVWRPDTLHAYSYGYNNPVKYVDLTGLCGAEAATSRDEYEYYREYSLCMTARNAIINRYGISVAGTWTLPEMGTLGAALADMEKGLGGIEYFTASPLSRVTVTRVRGMGSQGSNGSSVGSLQAVYWWIGQSKRNDDFVSTGTRLAETNGYQIRLFDGLFTSFELGQWGAIHEFGHVWDFQAKKYSTGWGMVDNTCNIFTTASSTNGLRLWTLDGHLGDIVDTIGIDINPVSKYGSSYAGEDWPESWAVYHFSGDETVIEKQKDIYRQAYVGLEIRAFQIAIDTGLYGYGR